MADEAIRSARTIFVASIVATLAWFFAAGASVESFRARQELQDLQAWDALNRLISSFSLPSTGDRIITSVYQKGSELCFEEARTSQGVIRPGSVRNLCSIPTLQVRWPRPDTFPAEVMWVKEGEWLKFTVSSSYSDALQEYQLLWRQGMGMRGAVVPSSVVADLDLETLVPNSLPKISQPRSWTAIALRLQRLGVDRPYAHDVEALSLLSAEVERLDQGEGILGLHLSRGLTFAGIGLIHAAFAFALLGPWLALRQWRVAPLDQPWIMIARVRATRWGWFLEKLILLVSIVWTLSPLAILVRQVSAGVEWPYTESVLVICGFAGLILASGVYAMLSVELWRWRRGGRLGATEHRVDAIPVS